MLSLGPQVGTENKIPRDRLPADIGTGGGGEPLNIEPNPWVRLDTQNINIQGSGQLHSTGVMIPFDNASDFEYQITTITNGLVHVGPITEGVRVATLSVGVVGTLYSQASDGRVLTHALVDHRHSGADAHDALRFQRTVEDTDGNVELLVANIADIATSTTLVVNRRRAIGTIPGAKGEKGDPGEAGDPGEQGIQGPPGEAAIAGAVVNPWTLEDSETVNIAGSGLLHSTGVQIPEDVNDYEYQIDIFRTQDGNRYISSSPIYRGERIGGLSEGVLGEGRSGDHIIELPLGHNTQDIIFLQQDADGEILIANIADTPMSVLFQIHRRRITSFVAGETGARGPRGNQGQQGEKGDKGDKGDTGDQGPIGNQGASGNDGAPGQDGDQGPQGIQGVQGATGPKGDKGDQGDSGAASTVPGPECPAGQDGAPGTQGERGEQGPQGETGEQGIPGQDGADSVVPGPQGEQGEMGLQGEQGPKGDKGDQGDPGTNGVDGQPGAQGIQGNPGPQGDQGPRGEQGLPGQDGADSTVPGPQGPQGEMGEQGIQGERGPRGPAGTGGGTGGSLPDGGTTGQTLSKLSDTDGDADWTDPVAGPRGEQGPQGETGPAGADSQVPGPRGPQGEQGDQGIQGPAGTQGDQGPAGANGRDGDRGPQGEPGNDGAQGIQGNPGARGPQGAQGEQGERGQDGADSTVPGPQGPQGDTGSRGPTGNNGTNGDDGVGYEYAHTLTATSDAPTAPEDLWLHNEYSTFNYELDDSYTVAAGGVVNGLVYDNQRNNLIAAEGTNIKQFTPDGVETSAEVVAGVEIIQGIAFRESDETYFISDPGTTTTNAGVYSYQSQGSISALFGAGEEIGRGLAFNQVADIIYSVPDISLDDGVNRIEAYTATGTRSAVNDRSFTIASAQNAEVIEGLTYDPNNDLVYVLTFSRSNSQFSKIIGVDANDQIVEDMIISTRARAITYDSTNDYLYIGIGNNIRRLTRRSKQNDYSIEAPNVTADEPFLWRSQRVISGAPENGDAIEGTWSTPTVFGHYGGEDGAGFEYGYLATMSDERPEAPHNNLGYHSTTYDVTSPHPDSVFDAARGTFTFTAGDSQILEMPLLNTGPRAITFNNRTNILYISNRQAIESFAIDELGILTHIETAFNLNNLPRSMAIDEVTGDLYYVSNQSTLPSRNELFVRRANGTEESVIFNLGDINTGAHMAIDQNTSTIYATRSGGGSDQGVNAYSFTGAIDNTKHISVRNPGGLTFDNITNTLFVYSARSRTALRFEIPSNTPLPSIEIIISSAEYIQALGILLNTSTASNPSRISVFPYRTTDLVSDSETVVYYDF